MFAVISFKKVCAIGILAVLIGCLLVFFSGVMPANTSPAASDNKTIKWVEFNVTESALTRALDYDVAAYNNKQNIKFVDILAYLGAKYGGDFKKYKAKDMDNFVNQLKEGKTVEQLTKDMKYFKYYKEAYSAVLDGFVGEYSIEVPDENDAEKKVWVNKYGLKVFSPIAKGFEYNDYDDFGASRSYGYKRKHLGHDMMGLTGTPIIAVESGVVEELGWNQYGGWRVGIRSFDGKRYYYYAHLRQNRPFHETLSLGMQVSAGDVIGYMGRTGYSTTENTNNIQTVHLHWGMELIFDEKRREDGYEIWIDVYEITKFLQKNKSQTYRVAETKEHYRKYDFSEKITTQAGDIQ